MIVPDKIEPYIGWRSWDLNDDGTRLLSSTRRNVVWEPGRAMEAECRARHAYISPREVREAARWADELIGDTTFQIPMEGCGCGIYAATTPEHARLYLHDNSVLGEVYLWGKVIKGESGFRAQYAYPKMIYVPKRVTIIDWLSLDANIAARMASATALIGHEEAKAPLLTHRLHDYNVPVEPWSSIAGRI